MDKLEVKTRKSFFEPKYSSGNEEAVVFLRRFEDRIEVMNDETVKIDIYHNGTLIFSGDKYEFFEQLKK